MEWVLILLLVVNFAGTALFVMIRAARKESVGIAVFFLFLPILGFVIYALPYAVTRLAGRARYDRDSLVHRNRIEKMTQHPDLEDELNIVPVEDAMAISENKEKRALLLRQLKKDISENYKALLAAEKDEDAESVHYAAATKMEVHRLLHGQFMECLKACEENGADEAHVREVLDSLRKLIESGVLSGREQAMYRKRYCDLMESRQGTEEGAPGDADYETWLVYLIESGRFQEAERLWREEKNRVKSENSYMKMAEMYYMRKDKSRFRDCIAQLQQDKTIHLTAQGLERLRYWRQKE